MTGSAHDHLSRREIDLAVGALMALHRCTEREAFDRMVRAVHSTGIGLGELSHALIAVVSGAADSPDSAARRHWATVMPPVGGGPGSDGRRTRV